MTDKDRPLQVEIDDSGILVDAALLGELLNVAPADIPALMRTNAITSIHEKGIDVHEGTFRLSFFYRDRRARLSIDAAGHVLQRSVISMGKSTAP